VTLELAFPALGRDLPTDHSYALYSALTRVVPAFHDPESGLRFSPVVGTPAPGKLLLGPYSVLRVRVPDGAVAAVLPLAGKALDLNGTPLRLGVPTVRPLLPAATLVARLVTVKHAITPEAFRPAVQAKLDAMGVSAELELPTHRAGPRVGEPRRRVVRIAGDTVVGYAVLLRGLSAADSLRVQECGLGGRTRLGCGFFMPVRGDVQ
jgi:CRISPR-associated protein Cas6